MRETRDLSIALLALLPRHSTKVIAVRTYMKERATRRKALSTKLNAVVAPGGYLAEFARSLSDEVLRPHLKKIGGAAALFILGEITKSFLRKPFVWSQVGTPVERLAGIVIEVVAAVIIIGGWAMISASGLYLWRYLNATVGEWLKK